MLPVHPHPEPLALLGLLRGEAVDARLAQLHEAVDAKAFDLALVVEAELALDIDLDPQALAVETVLVALTLAEHGVVALVEVLVHATPGVVHAHRVVGGDRPIQEGEAARSVRIPGEVALRRAPLMPTRDLPALELNHVELAVYRSENPRLPPRHGRLTPNKKPVPLPGRESSLQSRGTTRA